MKSVIKKLTRSLSIWLARYDVLMDYEHRLRERLHSVILERAEADRQVAQCHELLSKVERRRSLIRLKADSYLWLEIESRIKSDQRAKSA
jgi:hypothetical protein